jgi:hypothetical protein
MTDFIKNTTPESEKRFNDPPIDGQTYGLFSFVPAKGATPNERGVFGYGKIRGTFSTDQEASNRSEFIVKNVDSYHTVYQTFVGKYFPVTTSSDFSKEVNRVDMRKEMTSTVSEDVKKKREKEQQEIKEIEDREKVLLEDVKKNEEDMDDKYTTLKVKKAQLTWTYIETEKKMRQMCGLIAKAQKELEDLEKTDSTLHTVYYQKYVDARKKAGLSVDKDSTDESFMKYLVEDVHLPAVEEEYKKLFIL